MPEYCMAYNLCIPYDNLLCLYKKRLAIGLSNIITLTTLVYKLTKMHSSLDNFRFFPKCNVDYM